MCISFSLIECELPLYKLGKASYVIGEKDFRFCHDDSGEKIMLSPIYMHTEGYSTTKCNLGTMIQPITYNDQVVQVKMQLRDSFNITDPVTEIYKSFSVKRLGVHFSMCLKIDEIEDTILYCGVGISDPSSRITLPVISYVNEIQLIGKLGEAVSSRLIVPNIGTIKEMADYFEIKLKEKEIGRIERLVENIFITG